jgi:hypothetical protein
MVVVVVVVAVTVAVVVVVPVVMPVVMVVVRPDGLDLLVVVGVALGGTEAHFEGGEKDLGEVYGGVDRYARRDCLCMSAQVFRPMRGCRA